MVYILNYGKLQKLRLNNLEVKIVIIIIIIYRSVTCKTFYGRALMYPKYVNEMKVLAKKQIT